MDFIHNGKTTFDNNSCEYLDLLDIFGIWRAASGCFYVNVENCSCDCMKNPSGRCEGQDGDDSCDWDAVDNMGKPVSARVYLDHIRAGEFVQTKKMVLLK